MLCLANTSPVFLHNLAFADDHVQHELMELARHFA